MACSTTKAQSGHIEHHFGSTWRSHNLFILLTVGIGIFGDLFLYSLVIPILPFMLEDDLGIPRSQVQSYTSALLAVYAGANVISCPLAGLLADRLPNRKTPFLFALSCLLGATLMLFLGRTIWLLFVARVLQGISSAVVWTVGLAMCVETVGIGNMGKTMGSILSITAIGSLGGPFVGGMLYHKAGLKGVMVVAIAVIGIDLICRLLIVEKEKVGNHVNGSAYPTPLNQEQYTESQPLLDEPKVDVEQFELPRELPRIARMIPLLPCLGNASLLAALLGSLMQAIVMGSFDSTVALVAHELFGFDSFQAGILFLPMGVASLICGPIVGWAIDRHGTKVVAVSSFALLAPVLVLIRYVHHGGLAQITLYTVLLTLAGVGLAGSGTPSMVEAGATLERYHQANPDFFGPNGPYAMVYGINGMLFNAGLAIGPELAAVLKEAIGYGNMNLVLAVASGLTSVLCFFFLGGKLRRASQAKERDYQACENCNE